MLDRVQDVYEKLAMKEDVAKLNELLLYVHLYPHISTKRLAIALQLPKPLTIAIKRELIQAGFLAQERGVVMMPAGRQYVEQQLGFAGINDVAYRQLLESEDGNCPILKNCAKKYAEVFAGRPQADVTLDQAKSTGITSFKRAWLCLKYHALLKKRILCIGDDDLVSVALCLLYKELSGQWRNFAPEITVVEKDERIIGYIRSLADTHELIIRCIPHDVRNPLPVSLQGQCDVLFTDPPYTFAGMRLFLSRGLEGLKKQSGLPIFFSFGSKPAEDMFYMQQKWSEMNLYMKAILTSFNQYEGAQSLNNQGQMIVMQTMQGFYSDMPDRYEGNLYTMDYRQQEKIYVCLQCRHEIKLERSTGLRSIEQLKEAGCPNCGNKHFISQQKWGTNHA